jgi:hypothetical protein
MAIIIIIKDQILLIGAQLKHMVDVMDAKLDHIELNHMQLTLEEIAAPLKVPAGKPPAEKGPT